MLKAISELVAKLPWSMIILFCLTLGLAPFFPIPHVWEKLKMFSSTKNKFQKCAVLVDADLRLSDLL